MLHLLEPRGGDRRKQVSALNPVLRLGGLHIQHRDPQIPIVGEREPDQPLQHRVGEKLVPAEIGDVGFVVGPGCSAVPGRGHGSCRARIVRLHRAGGQCCNRRDTNGNRCACHAGAPSPVGGLGPVDGPDPPDVGRVGAGGFAADPRFFSSFDNLRIATKNTGTRKTANTVAVTIPPMTPVPIAVRPPAPAPVAVASGNTPRINANEVIRMGRRRCRAAATVASMSSIPWSWFSLANSTIRIAFFEARPTVVNNPTWKNTSLLKPRSIVANTVPMMPSGTTNMTATGIDQLSYSAARHRKTMVSEMAYNAPACEPDRRSS